MVYAEHAPHHAKGTLGHRVNHDAHRFLGRDTGIGAVVAFAKVAPAFLTMIPLFARDYTALYCSFTTAFFAL